MFIPTYVFAQTIELKSGTILLENMIPVSELNPNQLDNPSTNNRHYVFLVFDKIPTTLEKERIKNTGITLLDYVPNNSFIASIPEQFGWNTLSLFNISHVTPIKPENKLSRELVIGNYPEYALEGNERIKLVVFPFEDISTDGLLEILKSNNIKLADLRTAKRGIAVSVSISAIIDLAKIPEIAYLEPIEAPAIPEGIRGRTNHRANFLSTAPGSGNDGTGVTLAIADDGGVNHEDFRGRITDNTASAGGTHGDMTSGLAVGSGNIDPTKIGMATGAYLHLYGISGYPHVISAIANLSTLGTVITSTSYSQGCGGLYNATSRDIDQDVHDESVLLHVFSAGNSSSNTCSSVYGSIVAPDGRYYGNITGGRKAAKNVIAVANVLNSDTRVSSSSRGPCEDGRLKPDISATGASQSSTGPDNTYLGAGGTSAAAPSLAGAAAMLYQAYKSGNGGSNPNSTLIKGVLLNTADDLGRPGPDYDFGWGRVNTRRAVEVINSTQYLSGSVSNGGNNSHTVSVPSNIRELKVMVIWLDPEGSTVAAKALVNDLNMTVTTPSGQEYNPWVLSSAADIDSLQKNAYRGIDNVNNMEQVTLESPASGNYTVKVSGNAVPSGPQNYFVVYSYIKNEIVMTYPRGGESFVSGETEILHWDAHGQTGSFTLQYSTNGGSSWTTISSTVNGANRYYNWSVPATTSGQVRVRVTRGGLTGSSQNFNVMGLPSNIAVNSTGTSTAQVTWNAVSGANTYDVYSLGNKYMQIIGTTAGTSYNLSGLSANDENWYAVRARSTTNGITGRRSVAENYSHSTNTNSCTDCTNGTYSVFPYNEGFESGLGLWCQNGNDDIDWTRKSGSTTSANTGPASASEGAYYMYIEASSPNYPSKRAILESPCFSLPSGAAITMYFDFHMYGSDMGTLTLEASNDNGSSWNVLKTISGDQGDGWKSTFVDLTTYAGSNTILRFNGVTGNSYRGDMAIDRLKIEATVSSCASAISSFPYTQNFDGMTLCGNTSFSCNADGNCTLGSDWINTDGDDIDWSVDNSNTPSSSTGPSSDHTSGSGRYLYTEASSCFNRTGIIYTPCFNFSSAAAPSASFWYHLYGSNMGSLSVQVSTDGGDTWSGNVWTLSGNQGNSWNQATVNLASYAGQSSVILRFTGATGSSWQSDMAIDDFAVNAGSGESAESEDELLATSISETSSNNSVRLFPNPAKETITVQFNSNEHVILSVYDIVGNQFKSFETTLSELGTHEMNISNLPTGTYILRFQADSKTQTILFNIIR